MKNLNYNELNFREATADDIAQIQIVRNSVKENILDAAMKAGADVPFACKGGVCCTCRAKLLEGEVHMNVNYGLEKDEIENNFILTCQAYPKTKKLVVNFDYTT